MTTLRQALDATITEKEWQQTVIDYAHLRGWLTYHAHDSRRSAPGFPDLVMVRNRVVIFAELKTEKGQPTAEQYEWLYELDGTPGCAAFLWRPSSWPEVERVLA